MTKRVFNMGGGAHSDAAYTAFENAAYGSCVANATSLAVSAGGGMSVRIAAGDGIISTPSSGKRIQSDAIETVTISAANATYPRIDSVVVYIDSAVQPTTAVIDNVNGILKFAAVAGTPAANPAAPAESMIQAAIGAGNRYMVLADVKVPNGATSMNTATFTDRRKVATMVDGNNIAKKAVKADNIDFTTIPMFAATTSRWDNLPGGGISIVNYDAVEYDTANIFNKSTHQATVPVSGVYTISAKAAITSAGYNPSATATAVVYKNGAILEEMTRVAGSGNGLTLMRLSHTFDVLLNKGDVIDVRAHCSESRDFGGSSTQSRFSMRFVGNNPN